MECTDNTLLVEKLTIKDKDIIMSNSQQDRLYDVCNDPVLDIKFDYEFATILALKKSGQVEVYKNGVMIFSKKNSKMLYKLMFV